MNGEAEHFINGEAWTQVHEVEFVRCLTVVNTASQQPDYA
jgi:hypothetical protein